MIVFNLQCSDCSHSFEGWFGSSKSCETQIKKKLVQCVSCGSSNITKELSSPNVSVILSLSETSLHTKQEKFTIANLIKSQYTATQLKKKLLI